MCYNNDSWGWTGKTRNSFIVFLAHDGRYENPIVERNEYE